MAESGSEPLWVFGYGSLLWNPGFPHEALEPGLLRGYRRAFCSWSVRYRGTPEAPGLVLGLDPDPDGACRGGAFRVAAERAEEVRAYLVHREMGTSSYHEVEVPVELDRGGVVTALAYVMDVAHAQYVRLPLEAQAEVIARSRGPAGPNRDYLHATAARLRELGLPDHEMDWLDARVRALVGELDAEASQAGEERP